MLTDVHKKFWFDNLFRNPYALCQIMSISFTMGYCNWSQTLQLKFGGGSGSSSSIKTVKTVCISGLTDNESALMMKR